MNRLSYRKRIGFQTALALFIGLIVFLSFALAEYGFRFYLSRSGIDQPVIQKIDVVLEKAWFEPHPQLIYTFKPNHQFKAQVFGGYTLTTNPFGFRSGLTFDVKSKEKQANEIRVAALGGSTTMGVNDDDEFWAYHTVKNLQQQFPSKKITLINEGIMGYNSQDNLIDLSIRIVDFDPDVYILYFGINDYLMQSKPELFRSDYAHGKATLYENISFSIVELIPNIFLQSKMVQQGLFWCGVPDRRNLLNNTGTSLFRRTTRLEGKEKLAVNPMITETVIRNTRSMTGVIRAQNPDALIVLSTFYYYYSGENVHDVHQAVLQLNERFLQLAQEMQCLPADPMNALPYTAEMVYDYGHFTPDGDLKLGKLFSAIIGDALQK